jgi:hypothetical protein
MSTKYRSVPCVHSGLCSAVQCSAVQYNTGSSTPGTLILIRNGKGIIWGITDRIGNTLVLHCTALQTVQCTLDTIQCTVYTCTLHCTALHFTALHCTVLLCRLYTRHYTVHTVHLYTLHCALHSGRVQWPLPKSDP